MSGYRPRWTSLSRLAPLAIVAIAVTAARPSHAEDLPANSLLKTVGFDQKLNGLVPLDQTFRDESGKTVPLGSYFGRRPVLMALVYYECPMLCTQTLNGLTRSLMPLSLTVGKDFDVVVVSINPEETPELARIKKAGYVGRYNRPGSAPGWHFLTGNKAAIDRLARAVGFRYSYNPRSRLYIHAAGMVVLTPQGRIARYFYGIEFPPKDVQFGLIEAASEKIGSPITRVLLLCYEYDAATGKYTLAIMRLVRVLGSATAIALATFMFVMLRRERKRSAGPFADTHLPTEAA